MVDMWFFRLIKTHNLKNHNPFCNMTIEILVSEENLYLYDYHSEIWSPKFLAPSMFYLHVTSKNGANFHKSMDHTHSSHSLLWDSVLLIFAVSMKITV